MKVLEEHVENLLSLWIRQILFWHYTKRTNYKRKKVDQLEFTKIENFFSIHNILIIKWKDKPHLESRYL